jgi:serine protease Do
MTLPLGFGGLAEELRRSTVLITGKRGGAGSGIVLSDDGTIATNAHVVTSPEIQVQLWDGFTVRGILRTRDTHADLALISVSAAGLHPARLGDSNTLRVGQIVVAVGNPFGFLGAVSAGIIHGIGQVRGLGSMTYIQSDLQLAPGNSGGPLCDAAGELIGVNAMVSGRMGLSIPVDRLKRFAAGEESRAMMGIVVHPARIVVNGRRQLGLVVMEVAEQSPAEHAALLPGDILIGVSEEPITSALDLEHAMRGNGERVIHLKFLRGDHTRVRRTSVLIGSRRTRAA